MTRIVMHTSFIPPAAVRLLVTNRSPLRSIPLHSAGIFLNPTYDWLQLNVLLITPYQMPERRAISNNSGGDNTIKASSAAPLLSYRLRVQRRFRPIEDPARPALLPVLVGSPEGPLVQNRYRICLQIRLGIKTLPL